MKRACFIIILIVAGASLLHAQDMDFFDSQEHLSEWVDLRVKNAQKGKKEKVEMPFAVRTLAWGCKCPNHYIGVSPNVGEGPWVYPIAPKGFPKNDDKGYSLVVTGYFTGKIITVDLRDENGEPEEWLYKVPEFKVLEWKKNEQGYDVKGPKVLGN